MSGLVLGLGLGLVRGGLEIGKEFWEFFGFGDGLIASLCIHLK